MQSLYEKYKSLCIDGSLICLEDGIISEMYFCYPINAYPIGFEGCIMYCFISEYGDTVFAANPESCADEYVYPLAKNFADFMRLILACGSANPVEQIVWMNKKQFDNHIAEEMKNQTEEQRKLLNRIKKELSLTPMENPFEYVKELQKNFDLSKIRYNSLE